MTGNPATGGLARLGFFLVVAYGFSVVNIPIGLVGGFYHLGKRLFIEEREKERNTRLIGGFFISAFPIVGPYYGLRFAGTG